MSAIPTKLKKYGAGFRTFGSVVVFVGIGLADATGAIDLSDLSPLLHYFIPDQAKVGALMTAIPLWFGFCRFLTTTPMFAGHKADDADRKRDFDEGH